MRRRYANGCFCCISRGFCGRVGVSTPRVYRPGNLHHLILATCVSLFCRPLVRPRRWVTMSLHVDILYRFTRSLVLQCVRYLKIQPLLWAKRFTLHAQKYLLRSVSQHAH